MQQIRDSLASKLFNRQFTSINREASMIALTGSTTVELINANFIVDSPALFGTVDMKYVAREELWYDSMSLNVNDIPGGPPAVWRAVADADGFINSNYGWCIYSVENGQQYKNAYFELKHNPESRRAVMIYTRPSMWSDFNLNGRSDFMCTNAVQYLIRDGALHAIVQMRSNDAIMGFKNDCAWQEHVLDKLAGELGVAMGSLHWNAGSLHVYARHYYLLDHYLQTGEIAISLPAYKELYPSSAYIPT
jgi:thymidylate synthase